MVAELMGSMDIKTRNSNNHLTCVLKNFDKLQPPTVREDYDYPLTKNHFQIFCETEWSMFGVNWSSQGTIDFQIAWTVVNITLDNH